MKQSFMACEFCMHLVFGTIKTLKTMNLGGPQVELCGGDLRVDNPQGIRRQGMLLYFKICSGSFQEELHVFYQAESAVYYVMIMIMQWAERCIH